MDYFLHILIIINIYVVLAISLSLLAGYTGLLSICHAAFFGLGAYTSALLCLNLGWSWLGSVVVGMMVCGMTATVIGAVSLRFRDDYFVVATFAFQIIIYSLMKNWVDMTRGPMGLPGIPRPTVFGYELSNYSYFMILSLAFSSISFYIIWKLVNSPYGRVLRAIREDDILAQSLGKNVSSYKANVFVIGAAFAALAGGLYSSYLTYIDPNSFTINESIFILAIVIIGGSGSIWGSVIGALLLVSLPELLRFVGLPNSVAANVRQILYGGLLVIFMMWRPQGLLGKYSFREKDKNDLTQVRRS